MDIPQFPVLNFQDFIAAEGETLTTDSLKVSVVFRKRHTHVLAAITKLLAEFPPDFTEPNFRLSEYQDSTGRSLPMFLMTRDGFSILAMGFSGKKAREFKVAFLGAFNSMERYIKNQREGLTYRLFALQLEHKGKKEKASLCGRGLNEWRGEKPVIEGAMQAITEKMNPQLELVQKAA